jgi:hypothetical protein
MGYTLRQLRLYHQEAIHCENVEQAAATIMAVNLGFAGGKKAQAAVHACLRDAPL